MSRRIHSDFCRLSEFLNGYTLNSFLESQQIFECKAMHKKLYGLMVFVAEFNIQYGYSDFTKFLDEMCSDLLLSLFNWIQGMYKPSKLELRCAIENYLKAVLSINKPDVINEKSVYAIFDVAKVDTHFQTQFGKDSYDLFKSDYATLCGTVHSDPLKLNTTSALNHLPQYNSIHSKEIFNLYVRILENSIGNLYINFPATVDRMHPENKKDFLDCLSKTTKGQIVTILYS